MAAAAVVLFFFCYFDFPACLIFPTFFRLVFFILTELLSVSLLLLISFRLADDVCFALLFIYVI